MPFEWKWLRGNLDDPVEANSFASLRIAVGNHILTRSFDHGSGGERDAVNVPLYPLVRGLAENWWTLLYEPRKSMGDVTPNEPRHSLDSYVTGFVFPPVTVWSAGENSIAVDTPEFQREYSSLEFFSPLLQTTLLPRTDLEQDFFRLCTSVVERVCRNGHGDDVREAWDRVLTSLSDDDEKQYCLSAGRLGIDPYDPDALDITSLADGLSQSLFADICEAARPNELSSTTQWARDCGRSMANFPEIDVQSFGAPPPMDATARAWETGYAAARNLRYRLGLESLDPRRVVDGIFGVAVGADAPVTPGRASSAVEGIVSRANGSRIAIPKVPARLRRSTLCRGAYRAWKTSEGDSSAVTTAVTQEQQASRAFAAELLAPAEWLRERAGANGLTPSDVEEIAGENICPEQTVIWQAYNHGIPLRGIQLPRHLPT